MSAINVVIEEIEGPSPIRIVLSGGALPLRGEGLKYESELGGSTRTPIGTDIGTQSVTNLSFGPTEMQLRLEVPWIGKGDIIATGAATPKTPEEAGELFRKLQGRARQTKVTLAGNVRVGVLRKLSLEPTRGISIDTLGRSIAPGTQLEVTLTWEWAYVGERTPATANLAGADFDGKLTSVLGKLPTSLTPGAFLAEFFDRVNDGISSVLLAIGTLKNACKQVSNFVTAPARLVNIIAAAARGAARALGQLDDILMTTPEELTVPVAGGGGAVFFAAGRAKGAVRDAVSEGMEAVCAVFDALDQRKSREVGVRPGQNLADVAKRELGDPERWPSIAALNEIVGQRVPPATFVVEVPGNLCPSLTSSAP